MSARFPTQPCVRSRLFHFHIFFSRMLCPDLSETGPILPYFSLQFHLFGFSHTKFYSKKVTFLVKFYWGILNKFLNASHGNQHKENNRLCIRLGLILVFWTFWELQIILNSKRFMDKNFKISERKDLNQIFYLKEY